jgi:hypothetical protein
MNLRYLKYNEIDFELWDKTVESSKGGLPYAYSWFLNLVSPYWEAIVSEDYEFIMPLPVKSKYLLRYLIQPAYNQQLGVFSNKFVSNDILIEFIKKIPYFSYQISFNENNKFTHCDQLPNYVLNLQLPYKFLYEAYSKNTARNLQKARSNNLIVECLMQLTDDVKDFMLQNANMQYKSHLNKIFELIKIACYYSTMEVWCVKDSTGALISSACFYRTSGRLIYVFPVNSEKSKITSANFLLIDSLISKFSGNEMLLDFEGSEIDGVARFYKGFGAVNRPYYVIKKFRPSFLVGKI